MPHLFARKQNIRLVLLMALALTALVLQACVVPMTNAALNALSGDEGAKEEQTSRASSSGGTASAAPQRECKLNSDGTQTCGYNCMMGSNGTFGCASTPEGSCSMSAGGDITCSDPGQASAGAAQTSPASNTGDSSGSSTTSSARCCVNGAFYSCPSAADAGICIGEPMQLMSCLDKCGMDSSCEQKCLNEHGPRPEESECTRQVSRDGDCD